MNYKRQQGVTLIELMVTVAIIGIIAAVGYPSYLSFVEKSRRADAQATLLSFASAMERHFTVNNTYATTVSGAVPTAPEPEVFPSQAPLDGSEKYYNLIVQSANATSFEIRAVPKGAQSGDGCGTLTVAHTGARDVTGGSLSKNDCWN